MILEGLCPGEAAGRSVEVKMTLRWVVDCIRGLDDFVGDADRGRHVIFFGLIYRVAHLEPLSTRNTFTFITFVDRIHLVKLNIFCEFATADSMRNS